jgi:hypothetical protein
MPARMLLAYLLVTAAVAGCTNTQLRHSTVCQIKTLADLQHQIVLNNLAAFACDPNTIPSQANLTFGATQVIDSGTANTQVINSAMNSLLLTLGLSRGIVDQWTSVPVTDEMTLQLLRVAYRRSLGIDEDLYTNDLANRLAHRLKWQLISTGDLGVANALMYARGPTLPQLLDRAGWSGDDEMGFKEGDPAVKLWKKDSHDIISLNSDRIVQRGEVLEEEILFVAPALVDGQPHIVEGEKSPRVKVATPYAAEIRRHVLSLNRCLLEIGCGWVGTGGKKDVPKCACHVGHYCDCYVWILPEDQATFEEFTLKILRLSSLLQNTSTSSSSGVMFSPIQTR